MKISVASGVGRGPTEMSAYDAALAAAGVHNYNLVTVSSVVPADATVSAVDAAPDLGPAGYRLTVVQGHEHAAPTTGTVGDDVTAEPLSDDGEQGQIPDDERGQLTDSEQVVAGLGWATGPGPGLFYEASGNDSADVRQRIADGLDAGADLRDWTLPERETRLAVATPEPNAHIAAVVIAAYGTAERIGGPSAVTDPNETRQL
jgi:arginine decarboxylase